jgi:hypothetical protein
MAMENREKLGIFLLDFPNLRFKASPLCCHVDETPGKSSCLSRLNLLFSRFHRDHSTWKNSEKPSKDFPPSPQRYATRRDYEFSSTFPRQLFSSAKHRVCPCSRTSSVFVVIFSNNRKIPSETIAHCPPRIFTSFPTFPLNTFIRFKVNQFYGFFSPLSTRELPKIETSANTPKKISTFGSSKSVIHTILRV